MAIAKKTTTKTTKNPVGRPVFTVSEANRRFVEEQSGLGVPQEQIGAMIGCSDDTLRKHFEYELLCGKAKANAAVSKSLYKNATTGGKDGHGDVQAQTFWLKTQAGFKETNKTEITGNEGGPIEISDARARLLAGIKRDTE